MKNWIPAGVVFLVALICVLSIPYQRRLEITREANESIKLPNGAEIVRIYSNGSMRDDMDVVFRLPKIRSVDAWLDYLCEQNPIIGTGGPWIVKPNHLRVTTCCGGSLSYDPTHSFYRFQHPDSECVCTSD